MNHLKILGLAVVAAMALLAFFGASSASTAVLCETDEGHCAVGWDLEAGDKLTASLTSRTNAVFKQAAFEMRCSASHLDSEITDTGGNGKEVHSSITELSFTFCKCGERTGHVTVISFGTLRFNGEGTTVGNGGTRITLHCTGLASCIFGTVAAGTDVGRLTDNTDVGGPAELDAEATLTWSSGTGDSGQFICAGFGDTGTFTATYRFTGTDDLWLATT